MQEPVKKTRAPECEEKASDDNVMLLFLVVFGCVFTSAIAMVMCLWILT